MGARLVWRKGLRSVHTPYCTSPRLASQNALQTASEEASSARAPAAPMILDSTILAPAQPALLGPLLLGVQSARTA